MRHGLPIAVFVADGLAAPAVSISDGTHARRTPRCITLSQSFARLWQRASRTCAVDADCACYPTDIERFCAQDSVDRRTVAALERTRASYLAAGCPDAASLCSPYRCVAACSAGRCVDRP